MPSVDIVPSSFEDNCAENPVELSKSENEKNFKEMDDLSAEIKTKTDRESQELRELENGLRTKPSTKLNLSSKRIESQSELQGSNPMTPETQPKAIFRRLGLGRSKGSFKTPFKKPLNKEE